jgi:hypothetical protein
MTDLNLAKTNIKVSLVLAASFLIGSYGISFKMGEIYRDFTARLQKYDNYQNDIARIRADDSAAHEKINRRLARGGF